MALMSSVWYKEQKQDYGFAPLNCFDFFQDEEQKEKLLKEKQDWKIKYVETIERQERKWTKRSAKEHRYEKLADLKLLCRIGIPAPRRPNAWFAISLAYESFKQDPIIFGIVTNAMYKFYVETVNAERLNLSETYRVAFTQIERDVDRTFPTHPFFQSSEGIDSLRSVLCAFVIRKPKIAYCQSMNFIAAIFVLMFPTDLGKALHLFTYVIESILPPDYFTESMTGVHCDILVLESLLSKRLPQVAQHLRKHMIALETVCISWLSCMFIISLPIETTFRVWDALMHEGSKILFRVALALFVINEEKILNMEDTGMMYSFIKDMGKSMFDCDKLMETCFENVGSLSKQTIQDLRKDCLIKVQVRLETARQNREDFQSNKAK